MSYQGLKQQLEIKRKIRGAEFWLNQDPDAVVGAFRWTICPDRQMSRLSNIFKGPTNRKRKDRDKKKNWKLSVIHLEKRLSD